MATVAAPQKRSRSGRKFWIAGAVLLIVLLIVAGVMALGNAASSALQAPAGWETAAAQTGTIDATVGATGNVEPAAEAELRFAVDGRVTEVLVKPGDRVQAGQALARIESDDLELKLEQARADLQEAQATYQDLLDGATPQEIAEAQAQVAQAQGQFNSTIGDVTEADIAAARARLEKAQAYLARLESGAKETELRSAQARVQQAEADLAAERDRLSQEKTNAQLALDQAVADLTKAQAAYATAKQEWEHVDSTGKDPKTSFGLNDSQQREYYDAFVQAEADLHRAEAAVEQARIAYDGARQAEVTGIRSAEQRLIEAQADLDEVLNGADPDELASARADVASARAELDRLTGADRAGNVAAAQASVEIAQAQLEKLTADPTASELARAEAAVVRAEAAVNQAQRDLARATLTAPFAATIARVDLRVGEQASGDGVIVVADLSSFHVDVPVDELDVAQIEVGQPVRMTLDALPDDEITGTVTNISPLADKSEQGTTTYEVTVTLDQTEAPVRAGMTAAVQIVTEQKEHAVLVPRRAVLTEGGASYVRIPTEGQPTPEGEPAHQRREVQIGLSNAEYVEITSGLQPGDQVLVPPVVSTFNPVSQ